MTNLTPEEINRVLAEWMGPLYAGAAFTASLDAIATIEAKLTDEQWEKYTTEIELFLNAHWSDDITREILSLTALQRATLLCKVLCPN